jgi:hypothetical protein
LDIDSVGLLVLTQDGRVAKHIIGENSTVEKEYLVRVTGELSERGLALLNHGLSLDGEALKPAEVAWQNEDQLRFVCVKARSARSAACASWWACAWWGSSVSASAPSSWVICPPDSGVICAMTRCSDPVWPGLPDSEQRRPVVAVLHCTIRLGFVRRA